MTSPQRRPRIAVADISKALSAAGGESFPLILDCVQAAALLNVPVKSIRNWLADGRLDTAARKRGRRWFIWRDTLIDLVFNGENWS